MKLRCALLLAACSLVAATPRDEANKKDSDAMQGVWRVADVIVDGKAVPPEQLFTAKVTVKEDKMIGAGIRLGKENEVSFKIDATTKPKSIDIAIQKGLVNTGIYSIEGTTFKICRTTNNAERPKTLESKAGTGFTLIILKRER